MIKACHSHFCDRLLGYRDNLDGGREGRSGDLAGICGYPDSRVVSTPFDILVSVMSDDVLN